MHYLRVHRSSLQTGAAVFAADIHILSLFSFTSTRQAAALMCRSLFHHYYGSNNN